MNISLLSIQAAMTNGFLPMKGKESELLLQSVFNIHLPEWVCVMEVLTEVVTAPIGKTLLGPKTRS